jgi:hypothetical protein
VIATGVNAADGMYSWLPTETADSKIRISDTSNPLLSDESDGYFKIVENIWPTLRITSPIGGERWAAGTAKTITWTSSGIQKVNLFYEVYSGATSVMVPIASNIDAAAGFFSWTVPSVSSSANSGYTRVKLAEAAPYGRESMSRTFAVPSVRVESPTGIDKLTVGAVKKITWTSSAVQKVKLEFSPDNGVSWMLIADNVWADVKSFSWEVPFTRSSNCLIRISDMETPEAADQNDAPFTIANSIRVTQPDGRLRWTEGNTRNITWTQTGVDRVNIEFTKDGGVTWTRIASNVDAAPGFHAWAVPNIASEYCKLRVIDAQYPATIGWSPDFAIKTTHGNITFSSPNGGEYLVSGNHTNLTWTSTGVRFMRLDLSTDGGLTWTTIQSGISPTPLLSQLVPAGISSSNCLFRLMDEEDDTVFDTSNAPFIIGPETQKPASR